MKIDNIFNFNVESVDISKENYYIGKVTQIFSDSIYMQFENLNVSAPKILIGDCIQSSKISTYVIIDSFPNPLVGKIEQIKLKDSDNVHQSLNKLDDETIYPTGKIQIIGKIFIDKGNKEINVKFGCFNMPNLTDKIYSCPNNIIKKIDLNLCRTKLNYNVQNYISFSKFHNGNKFNIPIDDLYQQHLMIVGSTNSGKSTTALSIMNESIHNGVKYLILDPTGEYSESFGQDNLKKYVDSYTLGKDLHVENGYIQIKQWCDIFNANTNSQPAFLDEAIRILKIQHKKNKGQEILKYIGRPYYEVNKTENQSINDCKHEHFNIQLLAEQIRERSVKINKDHYELDYFKLSNNLYLIDKIKLFLNDSNFMNIFDDKKGYSLTDVLKKFYNNDKSLYINCSKINDGVVAVFISILVDKIFSHIQEFEKTKNPLNPFVFYLDEVHRYTVVESLERSLIKIAREGRKYGIFMALTSQSPNDVPDVLLSQIGTFIIHRLPHNNDIQTMNNFIKDKVCLRYLSQGEAILTSVNLTQDVKISVNKSDLRHQNITPSLLYKHNEKS